MSFTSDTARAANAARHTRAGGRPRREEEQSIKDLLDEAMKVDQVLKHLSEMVGTGDTAAIRLWLEYRWGKARQYVDVDINDDRPAREMSDTDLQRIITGGKN